MRLKLISPKRGGRDFLGMETFAHLTGKGYGGPPLALPTIAALTPPDIEVSITDENVEPIDFDEEVDIVGITCNISSAPRAYEVADLFRQRKVLVVLGGIFVSTLPEQAAKHADAVVIGEAESIWLEVINDFRKGKLQRFYCTSQEPDLKDSPIPRWDLMKPHLYNYLSIQSTRGCPFNCEFCSVKVFFGSKYRHKPIENVVREVENLRQIDKNKLIFFVDDNIVAAPKYTRELLTALIPLKIRWFGQAPVIIAKDERLLDLMYRSGCKELFIGFESLSQQSLDRMGKKINRIEDYINVVEKIHSHGISVFGSFMLGNDYEDETIFEKTVKFVEKANMPFALVNILVPPPSSRLYQRLEKEGRILHRDWSKYTGEYVCFSPDMMSIQTLQNGYWWVLRHLYGYESLYIRLRNGWIKILRGRKRRPDYFTRLGVKIYLSLQSLRGLEWGRIRYMMKSLWNPKTFSISMILIGLSFHDYAFRLSRYYRGIIQKLESDYEAN